MNKQINDAIKDCCHSNFLCKKEKLKFFFSFFSAFMKFRNFLWAIIFGLVGHQRKKKHLLGHNNNICCNIELLKLLFTRFNNLLSKVVKYILYMTCLSFNVDTIYKRTVMENKEVAHKISFLWQNECRVCVWVN